MAAPLLSTEANSFPPRPTLSPSYPDLVSLKTDLPYHENLDSKQNFIHTEYKESYAPRDSYFSTPAFSLLGPNEDFGCEEDDFPFPSFDNNSITTASPPKKTKDDDEEAKDDHWAVYEPMRLVDFLSHDWQEQDIWSSWKYVFVRERRKKYKPEAELANGERLENAAWRTWTMLKYDLKTISPESLNWMKDYDVTWLYGPLQVDQKSDIYQCRSPPPSPLSTCSSFLHKKPILKKKSASATLLENLSRVGDINRVQQSSPVPRRPGLRREGSGFSLPSYHTSFVLNTPPELSRQANPPRYSFNPETPSEFKHVLFNETVQQVQAIESDEDDKDEVTDDTFSESDGDDDGDLMMAPVRSRSNQSTPRSSFSDNKTIAPLPPTTLKYRKGTPEPQEMPNYHHLWMPGRDLQHSPYQETLKPPNQRHNFLLDDDLELNNRPWPLQVQNDEDYFPYTQDQNEPHGTRRTPLVCSYHTGENEEEAAMNNTPFGQAMCVVNTFWDITHVIWNVGWNWGR